MRIDANPATSTPTARGPSSPDAGRALSFAAALATASASAPTRVAQADDGKEGTAAETRAGTDAQDRLDIESIRAGFDHWFSQRRAQGADSQFLARTAAAQQTCLDIAGQALSTGGFEEPLAFVKSLGPEALQALQDMQGLADPIDPGSLTSEGAFNLLLPRELSRDVDQDGLTQVGVASLIVFPPNDAPPAVKAAWNQTMEGVDRGMQLTLELQLWGTARGDGSGQADFHQAGFDYGQLVDRAIDGAEFNLAHAHAAEQQAHGRALLEILQNLRTRLD